MSVQILKKWGNSPAVRIPVAMMEMANLKIDQAIEVKFENGRMFIEAAAPALTLDQMINAITPENCHAETGFGPAQGRETW